MLCQIVHPWSNLRPFCTFSLFSSAAWFFLKIHLRVEKRNFKIVFAVSPQSLAFSSLEDFRVSSANLGAQNRISSMFAAILILIVLIAFFLILPRAQKSKTICCPKTPCGQRKKIAISIFCRFCGFYSKFALELEKVKINFIRFLRSLVVGQPTKFGILIFSIFWERALSTTSPFWIVTKICSQFKKTHIKSFCISLRFVVINQ